VIGLLVAFLLAGPGIGPVRGHHQEGLVYTETHTREMHFEAIAGDHHFEWHHELELELRRTVLEVDAESRPSAERIEVRVFRRKVVKDPEAKAGTDAFPSQGKTFVWRRLKKRWALFLGDDEVTKKHPHLVEQLEGSPCDRLPPGAVEPGAAWEIDAPAFYRAMGMTPPQGVQGVAKLRLAEVEDGVATIPFEFKVNFPTRGVQHDETGKGTWRFDVARGLDVSFVYEGKFRLDLGDRGVGRNRLERRVVIDSPGSTSRDS